VSSIRFSLGIAAATLALVCAAPRLAPAQEQPGAEDQAARIERLVRQLGDDSPAAREEAQRQLESIGRPALRALDEATDHSDPEVASRAREAAARIRAGQPGAGGDDEGTRERPAEPPLPQPMPDMPRVEDMDQVFKELERQLQEQLPEGMGELFRDLFENMDEVPGLEDLRPDRGADPDTEPDQEGPRPRFRVWTWDNQGGPRQLEPGRSADLGTLGMRVGSPGAALRAHLGLERGDGLVVNEVERDGWAARSGLALYDVIVAVDGRAVRTRADLAPLEQRACTLEVYRRAQLEELEVPAADGERPLPAPERETPEQEDGEGRSF